jgi:hypothetical protein
MYLRDPPYHTLALQLIGTCLRPGKMAIHLHPMLLFEEVSAPNACMGALFGPLWRDDSIMQHILLIFVILESVK